MNLGLISIIVPVYNVERYLNKCVDSLINQTYRNIEILLIDDGSTDSSGNICDMYSEKDERIKVYHKENTGLGLTRNYGLEHVKGEYVVFVDSDDYISIDMIEIFWKEHIRSNCDTVISGYSSITNQGEVIYKETYKSEAFVGSHVKNDMLPRMIGSDPGKRDSIFKTVWAIMYSMKIINKYSIKFVSEREIKGEDITFQLEYFQHSEKTSIIADATYFYRYNPKSLSKKYKPNRFEESKKEYFYIKKYIDDAILPDKTYYRLSKMFFVELMVAFSQEQPSINKQNAHMCIENIKKICSDSLVIEVVNNYPFSKLSFKQKVYIFLIKHRCSFLLYYVLKFMNKN